MRFRIKVFTLFLVVAILTAALIAAFMYGPMTHLFMDLMRTNVLSIAATAAAMLDPEVHQKIRTRSDQETPDYKRLEAELRRARDANRLRDLYVKYIYSMRPYPQDPRTAEFVLDAEEEGVSSSPSATRSSALRDDEFQEEHAVQAALGMRNALKDLQERWANSEGRARDAMASLRIGIGINTGLAIVGNIGSKQRMGFTAIGNSITSLRAWNRRHAIIASISSSASTPTSRHAAAFRSNRAVKFLSKARRKAFGPIR